MDIIVDASEAIDGFISSIGDELTPDQIEKEINDAVTDQLIELVDYIGEIQDCDMTVKDLMGLAAEGYFSPMQAAVDGSLEDPGSALLLELTEVFMHELVLHGPPCTLPTVNFKRVGNLILVEAVQHDEETLITKVDDDDE